MEREIIGRWNRPSSTLPLLPLAIFMLRNIFACAIMICLSSVCLSASGRSNGLLLEAEGFSHRGGWLIDQQSMDQMGSPYLIAHGLGRPVDDAVTTVRFPEAGNYRIFVRTRNWVAPWMGEDVDPTAPGRFRLIVDGKPLDAVFGTVRSDWHWQDGGSIRIASTEAVEVRLRDLTGFNGRCDAILFVPDETFVPEDNARQFEPLRRRLLGLTENPLQAPCAKQAPFDLVVCGGGIAGIASAVSAARSGLSVALIQDRPLLGGNASSEIRVPICGRSNYPEYPNLGNLVYEIDPHPVGSAASDQAKRDIVDNEPNVSLYLSTRVFALEKEGRRIKAVIGRNIETNRELRFEGRYFVDCTGDGSAGVLAGNAWRMGRESRAETGEQLAPEKADGQTMGASIQWSTRETKHETTFPELPWAIRFTGESIRPDVYGGWNWEGGFDQDQIDQIEWIRDQGLRAVFGHWDYMKNTMTAPEWKAKVARRELAWAACIIGKRESRRLIGEHVLCEQDIMERRKHADGFVPFVWHIDLHYPHPHNAKHFPGGEFRAAAIEKRIFAYTIPYRCLCARDVDNLFLAGRSVSTTHVALGAIRVQRTTGMMGEVVGLAASLCVKHSVLPRDIYTDHLDELKALVKKGVAPKPARLPKNAIPLPISERGEWDLLERYLPGILSSPY